jgi:hypothetical protein
VDELNLFSCDGRCERIFGSNVIEVAVELGVSGEPSELAVAGDPQLLERELRGMVLTLKRPH